MIMGCLEGSSKKLNLLPNSCPCTQPLVKEILRFLSDCFLSLRLSIRSLRLLKMLAMLGNWELFEARQPIASRMWTSLLYYNFKLLVLYNINITINFIRNLIDKQIIIFFVIFSINYVLRSSLCKFLFK